MKKCPVDGTLLDSDSVKLKDGEICGQCAMQVGLVPGSSFTHSHAANYTVEDIRELMTANDKVASSDIIDFQKQETNDSNKPHFSNHQRIKWPSYLITVVVIAIGASWGFHRASVSNTPTLHLDKYSIDNVTALHGKATKGATVIFKPQNSELETEKVVAKKGNITDSSLMPGKYTVYAHKDGKNSVKKTLKVKDSLSGSYGSSAKESDSKSQSQSGSRYKKVSLAEFTEDTSSYEGTDIQTSGTVAYIQKNPDDDTMYYAVIIPQDEYDSSGYSTGHGTVTEIDVDTMKENSIHEGDTITVRGGAMTDTLKLNGKTLNSDIIVDSVSK